MRTHLEPPRPELRFLARFTVELAAPLWDLGPTRRAAAADGADHRRPAGEAVADRRMAQPGVAVGSALRLPDAVVHDAYLVT